MPGKSRRQKGQYASQSKKRKGKPGRPALPAQQSAVAQARETVSSPNVPAPPASVPVPTAKPAAAQYPHIASELRTIGLLAGIMLTILIVLVLVLS
jgi:hypothetical protein